MNDVIKEPVAGCDIRVVGEVDRNEFDREVTIALAGNVRDVRLRNVTRKFGEFVFSNQMSSFQIGDKDGECILQGSLIGGGGQRKADNMKANCILMLDIDTGMSLAELETKLMETGLACLAWTTHSHLKDVSEVRERAFCSWLESQKRGLSEETLLDDLKAYLREVKAYHPPVLERVTYEGCRDDEKDTIHVVKHQPMAKLRLLFLLEAPFEFGDGASRKVRIKAWKSFYKEVAGRLGVPFDESCSDPSRLMYTPRRPEGSEMGDGLHEIVLFAGGALDLENLDACLPPLPELATGDDGSKASVFKASQPISVADGAPFVTKNLVKFARIAGHDFEMADFMVDSYGEEHIRRGNLEDGSFDFRCPREDWHSQPDDRDTAFRVINASANEGKGFAAWCLHNGCKKEWGDDRLRVLDSICQDLAIDDAMELITPTWTPNIVQPEHVDDAIEALGDDHTPEDLERICQMIARLDRTAYDEPFVRAINTQTKLPVKSIRDCIASERRKWKKEVASNKSLVSLPAPEDYASLEEIDLEWGHTKVVEATVEIAIERNRKAPKVFVTGTGETQLLRFPSDDSRPNLTGVTIGHWRNQLLGVRYVKNGSEFAVPPDVLQHLNGDALYGRLPRLMTITRVPIFNADGKIITVAGYDPGLKAYFAPNMAFKPVPTDGTAREHVAWAVNLLLGEAYRDFPFSDQFRNAVDDLPIYTDERDDKGHPKPNLERGKSSRAHVLAMTLQPLVRPMISGATPMYFIDKSRPGSGAGYLANVVSIAMEGKPAQPQRMSSNDEEFAKSITASLFQQRPMMFIDNVDGTIGSPTLAAAITTGEWTDRLLGKSEMVTVPVEGLWVIGGNNVNFTHELVRRLVPIRLDAGVPNPEDRPSETFKHRMPRDYINMRPDLVFACHILIQNWIDRGRPRGEAVLSSFEDWSEVTGGILKAAGVEGFLQNLKSFKANMDEEDDTARLAVQMMYEAFGLREFTLDEFIKLITHEHSDELRLDIGTKARSESGQRRAIQDFVKNKILGSPFVVPLSYGQTVKVQLEADRKPAGYEFKLREV